MNRPTTQVEDPSQKAEQAPPSDLLDFYRRWPELRPTANSLLGRPDLPAEERRTLYWLIQLADRVSEHDL
jgi:hypothetical protein